MASFNAFDQLATKNAISNGATFTPQYASDEFQQPASKAPAQTYTYQSAAPRPTSSTPLSYPSITKPPTSIGTPWSYGVPAYKPPPSYGYPAPAYSPPPPAYKPPTYGYPPAKPAAKPPVGMKPPAKPPSMGQPKPASPPMGGGFPLPAPHQNPSAPGIPSPGGAPPQQQMPPAMGGAPAPGAMPEQGAAPQGLAQLAALMMGMSPSMSQSLAVNMPGNQRLPFQMGRQFGGDNPYLTRGPGFDPVAMLSRSWGG